MRSDREMLVAEFPELGGTDVVMQKEVFAHFGLAFMKFGLVEHSMVNILTFQRVGENLQARTIRSRGDWERAFDDGYANAIALTFGNQVKRILTIEEFTDIEPDFAEAKRLRDYFAHHFMREEAGFFGDDEGCWLLLSKIAEVRHAILRLEEALKPRFDSMRSRYQLPRPSEEQLDRLLERYRAEHTAALKDGSANVGWSKNAP
jgi:hypothetical protein